METSHSQVKLEIITGESPVCGILLCTLLNNIWVSGEISREKNILNCAKLGRTEELGGKTGVLAGLDLPRWVGELKQGSDPHSRATV